MPLFLVLILILVEEVFNSSNMLTFSDIYVFYTTHVQEMCKDAIINMFLILSNRRQRYDFFLESQNKSGKNIHLQ